MVHYYLMLKVETILNSHVLDKLKARQHSICIKIIKKELVNTNVQAAVSFRHTALDKRITWRVWRFEENNYRSLWTFFGKKRRRLCSVTRQKKF